MKKFWTIWWSGYVCGFLGCGLVSAKQLGYIHLSWLEVHLIVIICVTLIMAIAIAINERREGNDA